MLLLYNIRHIYHQWPPWRRSPSTINLSGSSCQRCTRSSRSSSLDLCAKRAGRGLDLGELHRPQKPQAKWRPPGGGSSSLQTYQDLGTGTQPWHRKPWFLMIFEQAEKERAACWNNMDFFFVACWVSSYSLACWYREILFSSKSSFVLEEMDGWWRLDSCWYLKQLL